MRRRCSHLFEGARLWRRRPGQALVIVATLSLALALASGFYSLLHGVILEQLPYPQPDQLGLDERLWASARHSGK